MAGKFIKISRIILPFMTLVIMTSQLAGCATTTSQPSLEASQVIGTGDQQHMADSDLDIGLIEDQNNQKLEEISHDELLVVFEQQYEISKEINNSECISTKWK